MAPTAASTLAQEGWGYRVDDLTIDVARQRVTRDETELSLSALSFELLLALVREAPNVVSIDTLMARVWPGLVVGPETVSQRIKLVRDALEDDAEKPRYIVGVRGRGYRMLAAVTALAGLPPERPAASLTPPVVTEAAVAPVSSEPAPLWTQLRARGVPRVAASYAVIASLLVQLGSIVVPTYGLPNWTMAVLLTAAIIGFPIAIALAWFLEMTPEGTVLDLKDDALPRRRIVGVRRYADVLIIAALAIAVAYLLVTREPGSVVVSAPRTIAVLPFVNLSGNKEYEYFSDGLTEEMINRLAGIPGIQVAARTSSFYLKGRNEPLHTIAEMLRVRYLLEGSVRQSGDKLRVTSQLTDTTTGFNLWSRNFERPLADIFAIRDEVATAVVESLKLTLPADLASAPLLKAAQPTSNFEAYTSYLRGQYYLRTRAHDGLERALKEFQHAVELDPQFARAHVGISSSYTLLAINGHRNMGDVGPVAEAAVERAVELDPQLAEAWAAKGHLVWNQGLPLQEALSFLERSIALNPHDSQSLNWLAYVYSDMRRYADAHRQWERAYALDPLWFALVDSLALSAHALGDKKRALELANEVLRLAEGPNRGFGTFALIAEREGRADDVIRWRAKALKVNPRSPDNHVAMAWSYLELEDFEAAARHNQIALQLNPTDLFAVLQRVVVLYRTGDTTGARAVLDVAEADHPGEFFVHLGNAWYRYMTRDCARSVKAYMAALPLLNRPEPEITGIGVNVAPEIIWCLRKTGDSQRADALVTAYRSELERMEVPGNKALIALHRQQLAAATDDREGVIAQLDALWKVGSVLPSWAVTEPLFENHAKDSRVAARLVKHAARRAEWRAKLASEGL